MNNLCKWIQNSDDSCWCGRRIQTIDWYRDECVGHFNSAGQCSWIRYLSFHIALSLLVLLSYSDISLDLFKTHHLQDEKDKRIRELSLELYNERQKCKRRCAAYEEQLNAILKDLEKHTDHISNKVADIVQSIKTIEEEQSEDSDSGWS